MRRAIDFRKAFTWGGNVKGIKRRRISPRPAVLVKLGALEAVTYQTKKRGESVTRWIHDFKRPLPDLAMDIDNKKLHIVGGGYTVTDAGIEG